MTSGFDREAFERDGWTVVDLRDEAASAAALRVIDEVGLEPDHPFFASPAMSWGAVAGAVDRDLKAIVKPASDQLLPGHRAFMAGITSKGARSTMPIPFHQDWTYTDERVHRVVFLWTALVDTEPANGGLWAVSGSHRWSTNIRPSRDGEATHHLQDEFAARAEPVRMRAGQAVVFDPAVVHGSGPNTTDQLRPAFTMAFVPDGVPLLHFHEHPDGRLEGLEVDDAFFTQNPYRSRPVGYPPAEPFARALTDRDLLDALDAHHPASQR